jgi:transposase InsO family protein
MDPVVSDYREAITVTPNDIVYQRRLRVLAHAGETGNVSETCRTFGISRTTFYRWRSRAAAYGPEALLPKGRRRPQAPNATPTWVVTELLAEAVVRPTLGARRLADWMATRGFVISRSCAQDILNRHQLGRRSQRVAALAQLTAATTGLVTRPALEGPFGFCHWAGRPGDLVGMDCFYVGKLKGVGEVWQLTAVDTHSRWAIARLTLGRPTGAATSRFLHHVTRRLAELGVTLRRVLTDNGGEFTARTFTDTCRTLRIDHHRIPARSPDHNAVCERFHDTALQECWRPAFHRRLFTTLRQLQAELDAWLTDYNQHRPNRGDYMNGRRPTDLINTPQ